MAKFKEIIVNSINIGGGTYRISGVDHAFAPLDIYLVPKTGGGHYRVVVDENTVASIQSGSGEYAPLSHVGSGGSEHSLANSTTAGFMSPSDYVKLGSIDPSNTMITNTGLFVDEAYREIDNLTFEIDDTNVKKFNIVFDSTSNGHILIRNLPNAQYYQVSNFSASNSIEVEVDGYGVVDSVNAGVTKIYMAHHGGHLHLISSQTNQLLV